MTRWRSVGGGAVATVCALLIASPGRGQDGPPAAVSVDAVQMESVQEHRLVSGQLRAVRRSRVATKEPGLLIDLLVREGQPVSKGDVLARLDSRRLELELAQIEADAEAVAGIIEERKATLTWRQRDLELNRASFERGASNPRELLDAESAVTVASARVRQAERQHAVVAARAALVKERLSDMNIIAPFDGVVVTRHAELGEWIGEGDPVLELVSSGKIEVWLNVPQRYFGAVAGKPVAIALDIEATGQSLIINEKRVIPEVDPRARSFIVVATLGDNQPRGRLTPGMSVTAWVPTGRNAERLTVAKDAVLRNETGPYVYVARGGGRYARPAGRRERRGVADDSGPAPANAILVRVKVLFPLDDRFVIDSTGLVEGDLVVVEGNERLSPMMPIIPLRRDASEPPATFGAGP